MVVCGGCVFSEIFWDSAGGKNKLVNQEMTLTMPNVSRFLAFHEVPHYLTVCAGARAACFPMCYGIFLAPSRSSHGAPANVSWTATRFVASLIPV